MKNRLNLNLYLHENNEQGFIGIKRNIQVSLQAKKKVTNVSRNLCDAIIAYTRKKTGREKKNCYKMFH